MAAPNVHFDQRFSQSESNAADWPAVEAVLSGAELYWLTTVRGDGRPHITPLVGLWADDAFYFCTGPTEQKSRNLVHGRQVAVTTGVNTWKAGHDVIVEGLAEVVDDVDVLTRLAHTYFEKYGGEWDFTPGVSPEGDNGFGDGDEFAYVYRVVPAKVLSFTKDPHAQTRFRF